MGETKKINPGFCSVPILAGQAVAAGGKQEFQVDDLSIYL
jgi:hypothetical protein